MTARTLFPFLAATVLAAAVIAAERAFGWPSSTTYIIAAAVGLALVLLATPYAIVGSGWWRETRVGRYAMKRKKDPQVRVTDSPFVQRGRTASEAELSSSTKHVGGGTPVWTPRVDQGEVEGSPGKEAVSS
jgi:hypothetical protein